MFIAPKQIATAGYLHLNAQQFKLLQIYN